MRDVRDYVLQIEDYLLERAGNKPVAQMLALNVCRAARNVSNNAEAAALRDGFLLALYLANSERDYFHSLVQRQNNKKSYSKRTSNARERHDTIRARALELAKDHDWPVVLKILKTDRVCETPKTKKNKTGYLSDRQIREIIKPIRSA